MRDEWLRKFLNVYWLRPENALWRTVNCMAMEDIEFMQPSLDLSCGDGIFTFLLAGGEFDQSFDIFTAVTNLDHFFENVDIYDATTPDYQPTICENPRFRVSVGTDWKQNLLHKATKLGLYERLVLHDNNEPLPFVDGSFKTVFSNSVYWVEKLDQLLSEVARILQPDGHAVLVLKTARLHDYTLDGFEAALGSKWLGMIDRGRKASYPLLLDESGWELLFAQAGLEVTSKRPAATWVHAHLWDIGLRPISPFLIEMANSLDLDQRKVIKRRWIDTWVHLLQPFCSPQCDFGVERPPAEVVYVLQKVDGPGHGHLRVS